MRFEHDIDVYSLCESVYYSCNNDEYDYVLECVNDWIMNGYNDNILLEDIVLNEYTDEGLAKKLGFDSVDQMYNFHSDWYNSTKPYSDMPWDDSNIEARKAMLINQHLAHKHGNREISKATFKDLRDARGGNSANTYRWFGRVAKNNGYSRKYLQNMMKNAEAPSIKGKILAGKDALALTLDAAGDLLGSDKEVSFYARIFDDAPIPSKVKSGLKKIFRTTMSMARTKSQVKSLLKGSLNMEQKAQLSHYLATKIRTTDFSNISPHIEHNATKLSKTLSSALSKLGVKSANSKEISDTMAGFFGSSQHIAQQLSPDIQKVASMNSNNKQLQNLSNNLKRFGNFNLDNQHMNKLTQLVQRTQQVLGNHNIDISKLIKNDPKAIGQLEHKLDMLSIDNIKNPVQAMAAIRSLQNTTSNIKSEILGDVPKQDAPSPTPLEDNQGKPAKKIKKLRTGLKGKKTSPQNIGSAQPTLTLPEIDRSKIPDASPIINQSRLSRATTWMKNNKGKTALGVGLGAAAIGGGIYAYKQYKNKPRSVIAKRIAALRGVYRKFMLNAQRNPQKANIFKRIAAKILSVIDKLMAFMQNTADGR